MTKKRLLYFLIAGEASGDQLGGQLMRDLKKQHQGNVDIIGIGGLQMKGEGLQSLFPMEELSIMGFLGILAKLPHLLKRIKETVRAIQTSQPDVVITIDAPEFSFRVAKAIKKSRTGALPKLIHYVAPTVWAWRPQRAQKIAKIFDELWCLYPFEPPYFEKHGLKTIFVGHPLANVPEGDAARFYKTMGIPAGTPILTLLPGSRRSEVEYLLPLFKEATDAFLKTHPEYRVVLPTVPHVEALVQEKTKDWAVQPLIFMGDDARRDAFAASSLALAASGTVALELGLAGVPFVIAYKMSKLTALVARRIIKTPYACMINILLNRPVIPELLQEECTSGNMITVLETLHRDATSQKVSQEVRGLLKANK